MKKLGKVNKITVTHGEIAKIATVAIVNTVNSLLLGSGGVGGAYHGAGRPVILAECQAITVCLQNHLGYLT